MSEPLSAGDSTTSHHQGDSSNATDSSDIDANKVGYKRPPLVRRFKDCGNLNGRPKHSKNRKKIVREVANEMYTVIEGGKKRRRSTLELVLIKLRNLAMQGNVRAFREWNKLLTKYVPESRHPQAGVLLAPPVMTIEEAIAEGERANAIAAAERQARLAKKAQGLDNGAAR